MRLAGKTAVVTGAGRGIGAALTAMLRSEGASVVINDVDAGPLHTLADATGALPVALDCASDAGATALVSQSISILGRIDIWFGNAGIARGAGLNADDGDWAASYEVNVLAHVRAARSLVPHWLEQGGGRYVLTASAAGLLTMLDAPAYSVTKHGAVAFAEWLSATYRDRGIVVQALCPQGVRTRMLAEAGALQELLTADGARSPEEVARSVRRALDDDRFLILPHPEVAGYYASRAQSPDHWLTAMNKLQQGMNQATNRGPDD